MANKTQDDDEIRTTKEIDKENNKKFVSNAADVAIASGEPHAAAIGAGIKAVDKFTGGKGSEIVGDALTKTNQMVPGGQQIQQGINKMNESGMTDKMGQAASMYNGTQGNPTSNPSTNDLNQSGLTDSGLSESMGKNRKKDSLSNFDNSAMDSNNQNQDAVTDDVKIKVNIKKILIPLLPVIMVFFLFLCILIILGGGVEDFNDALGISALNGDDTGEIIFEAGSKDAQDFYERVNKVKFAYQAEGKTIDPLRIIAVYHVMNSHNNDYDYSFMSISKISEIADCMFNGNMYSEEEFKKNLKDKYFKTYFKRYSKSDRETMVDEVFDYIDRYYSFIGKDSSLNCAASGSCMYNVKGFYIPDAGNIKFEHNISNLMVRLMECGGKYGNGSYTTPIDQPLVPFEEYVAGVAYAEIGPGAPLEATKAQMVASRSYALARPTGMGNALGKKLEQEGTQWILQLSSCVADQVFCNINEGCSYMGGGDGQGGVVRSGNIPGAERTRGPLPMEHVIRTALAETQGEVLVNSEGYIIQTGFLMPESIKFTNLAKAGMNYKQILLEVYNSSSRPYGAADIQKMACNTTGSSSCGNVSTGPFASWKQYEGPWAGVIIGDSGKTIKQIGCLLTSVSILIAKSGVETVIPDFNPGTFVEFLNKNGGIAGGGNFIWASATKAAPKFKYNMTYNVAGYSKQQKLNAITEMISNGCYITAEVKGNTGQHWVAIDAVNGSTVQMMDPGSAATDMWAEYPWQNTSALACYKVDGA